MSIYFKRVSILSLVRFYTYTIEHVCIEYKWVRVSSVQSLNFIL